MGDTAEEIARDVAAVGRIEAIPTLLQVLCEITGMGFAAVARVTDGTWTACAVRDQISFGLEPGGQLDVDSTLCKEVRKARLPIVISHASADPVYRDHHTPRRYSIESYVSVPIVLPGGSYFGNLCAIDPRPADVSHPRIVAMFEHFAQLIAVQLEGERRRELVQTALFDERAAGELREQMIAILGHDLRGPLGAIAMNAARLKVKAAEPAAIAALASEIAAGAKRAAAIIDDTLDFARGRLGGTFDVERRPVEQIDEALFGVVTELQALHPQRSVDWQFGVHGTVEVDRGRIQQLASHLLANALEHGAPDGPVRIAAATTPDDLTIEIHNEGNPIPQQRLAGLLAPAWRPSGVPARDGLGLGLYICSRIVAAHQGRLDVVSSATAGTTFTATLPRRAR